MLMCLLILVIYACTARLRSFIPCVIVGGFIVEWLDPVRGSISKRIKMEHVNHKSLIRGATVTQLSPLAPQSPL